MFHEDKGFLCQTGTIPGDKGLPLDLFPGEKGFPCQADAIPEGKEGIPLLSVP